VDGTWLALGVVGLAAAVARPSRGSSARRKRDWEHDPYFEYRVTLERTVTARQRATIVVVAQGESEAKSAARDRMEWEGNDARRPPIDWTPNPISTGTRHSGDKHKVVGAYLVSGKRVYPGIPRITDKKKEA